MAEPKALDLRSQILGLHDVQDEIVEVPQWQGLKVKVRGLTGRERAAVIAKYLDGPTGSMDYEAMYPELVIAGTYDPETDERLFHADDLQALLDKSSGALEFLAKRIMRHSGLGDEAEKQAGKVS